MPFFGKWAFLARGFFQYEAFFPSLEFPKITTEHIKGVYIKQILFIGFTVSKYSVRRFFGDLNTMTMVSEFKTGYLRCIREKIVYESVVCKTFQNMLKLKQKVTIKLKMALAMMYTCPLTQHTMT